MTEPSECTMATEERSANPRGRVCDSSKGVDEQEARVEREPPRQALRQPLNEAPRAAAMMIARVQKAQPLCGRLRDEPCDQVKYSTQTGATRLRAESRLTTVSFAPENDPRSRRHQPRGIGRDSGRGCAARFDRDASFHVLPIFRAVLPEPESFLRDVVHPRSDLCVLPSEFSRSRDCISPSSPFGRAGGKPPR